MVDIMVCYYVVVQQLRFQKSISFSYLVFVLGKGFNIKYFVFYYCYWRQVFLFMLMVIFILILYGEICGMMKMMKGLGVSGISL